VAIRAGRSRDGDAGAQADQDWESILQGSPHPARLAAGESIRRVIVRPDLACAMSRHVPRLAFADAGFARQVKGWMKPPKVTTQFFVEARRVAA